MNYFFLLLFSFVSVIAYADSGGDDGYHKKASINNYESTLNLEYLEIEDTVRYIDSKNKVRKYNAVSNIAVYDITKDQTSYIFKDTIKRVIVNFQFESMYLQEFKTVEFNNAYNPKDSYNSGLFSFSNNFNVSQRPVSNNLIIATEDAKGIITTIWVCDKYGNNLRKAFEFSREWSWEIDVKNQTIRLSRQIGLQIEIKNFKY